MEVGRKCSLGHLLAAVVVAALFPVEVVGGPFDELFTILYGQKQVSTPDGGNTMVFAMDQSTGSGFRSKLEYTSGSFEMRIKLPNIKISSGVITTYYFTSIGDKHSEIDLEFIGGKVLQTNLFIDDVGSREQKVDLWFDASADFHRYKILWNPNLVAIYVDDIPIRFMKMKPGNAFFTKPQFLQGTLWSAPDWAGPVDWSKGPFKAYYAGPYNKIEGCAKNTGPNCDKNSWWSKVQSLDQKEMALYDKYKSYRKYDYCTDKTRKPPLPNDCS